MYVVKLVYGFLILPLCRVSGNRITNDIIICFFAYIRDVKVVVELSLLCGKCSLRWVRRQNSVSNKLTTIMAVILASTAVTETLPYVDFTPLSSICSLM